MTASAPDPLRDDEQDEAPKGNARRLAREASDVQPTSRVPQQTEVSEPPDYQDPTSGGARFLNDLMRRSPFLDYFIQVAEASYQGKNTEPKMKKAKQEHQILFAFCIAADMTLRVIVVILILALIVAVAYKTLSPLGPDGGGASS